MLENMDIEDVPDFITFETDNDDNSNQLSMLGENTNTIYYTKNRVQFN